MPNSLHANNRSGSNGQGRTVYVLSGRALRRLLHGKTSAARARICANLVRYNIEVTDLSASQLARLCAVNPGQVSVALGHAGLRGPRDSTLDRLIRKYGPDTLLRAVDRATTPTQVAAE
jgi:hypothetical protein